MKPVRYFNVDPEPIKGMEHGGIIDKKTVVYNVKARPKGWSEKYAENNQTNDKYESRYPRKAPISPHILQKYSYGEGVSKSGIKTNIHKKKLQYKEQNIKFTTELAARAEILLPEDSGYLNADVGETTTQFTQKQIVDNVDITVATKSFELQLKDFGPYRGKYIRNGRHLILGGKKGHVAAFDWLTKKLHCEMNVMEEVYDVCWLHLETMFAVAQKSWLYIYDHQGIELHCIKQMNNLLRLEFLPYHFLLASSSEAGFLSWLDISIGQIVNSFNTRLGRLNIMAQNPYNAVLCVGDAKGVVSMWSPSTKDSLAKVFCHISPLTALHVDPKGLHMATAATDRSLKIWDVRNLGAPMQTYILRSPATNVELSQRSMLAVAMGNVVDIYRDCCFKEAKRPYMRQRFNFPVSNFNFCPYEDVLGVSTEKGFSSLLIPGAGEPNYDALEANPFQAKSQRREAEVKALLEKIQPDLITLDPTSIADVDAPTLKEKIEAKKSLLYLKPPKIKYDPRKKAKGRGGVKIARNKKILRDETNKDFLKKISNMKEKNKNHQKGKKYQVKKSKNVLDRFLSKK